MTDQHYNTAALSEDAPINVAQCMSKDGRVGWGPHSYSYLWSEGQWRYMRPPTRVVDQLTPDSPRVVP